MLADSLMPITLWVKAVNTACYVLNRALVTKHLIKTPYELLNGRSPRLDFMKPFGYPVTIFNTLDPLGKFKGKVDARFLVGYSVTSKSFKVINTKTRKVEENLHVRFFKNKPNVAGSVPNWLFDINSLTNSMNYIPVSAGNQTDKNTGPQDTNGKKGTQGNVNAGKEVFDQHHIVLPLWSSISFTYKSSDDKAEDDKPKDDIGLKTVVKPVNKEYQAYRDELDKLMSQEKEASDATDSVRKDNLVNAASTSGTFSAGGPSFPHPDAFIPDDMLLYVDQDDSQIPDLEDTAKLRSVEDDFNNMESSTIVSPIPIHRVHINHPKDQILGDPQLAVETRGMAKKSSRAHAFMEPKKVAQALDDESWVEAVLTKCVYKNKIDEKGIVVRNKARLVAQGHKKEGINYDEVFAHVARIEAIKIFLAFASYMGFIVYKMDVKSAFFYGTIEEEVYVCQPLSFIDPYPNKVYKVDKALYGLHQAPRAWHETLSTFLLHNRYRKGIIDKTLFIKIEKDDIMLVQVKQNEEGIFISQDKYVTEILEMFDFVLSMIGSLMYLIASKPGIMFVVCACSRFQCKKQTIVATSTTKAEYVAPANCYGQIEDFLTSSSIHHDLTVSPTIYASNIEQFWNTANSQTINDKKQIHATVDGKTVVITESLVKRDLLFTDDNGITKSTVVEGEGLRNPLESQPTPSHAQPISENQIPKSSSSPQNTQSHRQTLEGTSFPHTRGPNFPYLSMDVEETLNELNPQGEGSSSSLEHQETMGGAMAQIRFEGAPIKSSDLPLSTCNTVRSKEDMMEHAIELTDHVPQTPHDLPLSGGHTLGSDEASLKKRVTKLEQRQSSRILGFHPFRADTFRRHSLGRRSISKQGRKNLKSQQKFQDTNDLVDEEVIVEDKGSCEKGGSTTKTISAARPNISDARQEVSIATPKTPPTTTTLFDDEDVTIADTLVKMKSQKAKEKGVAFKDTNKRDQDQIERDAEVTLKIQANLDEEAKTEIERQEEASKAALAILYDEVQAQIDVDHELAAILTHEEQEKYTIKERSKFDKELKKWLKVVPYDDKAINYETLDVKSPIVDCESQVLGTMETGDVNVYKLTRLDGSYIHFLNFSRMLEVLDRQDVLDLHNIVMERFLANDPDGYDLILWGDLRTLMESSKDDEIWRNQHD
nr:hypothetical protein [Tanacetum cinerariifolium]